MDRPEIVTDDHLEYLDDLMESGKTNMFGAGVYLRGAFDVSKEDSLMILSYWIWMKTFSDRHRQRLLKEKGMVENAQMKEMAKLLKEAGFELQVNGYSY